MNDLQALALAIVFWGGLFATGHLFCLHIDDGWPWWPALLAIVVWLAATYGMASL
ncbi:hypothetical protein A7A08_01686 [Methyloligella halotolerans]|uniref:Uncharacterized protein n=1 Tax=Methyloligella halotolerans TaxID=1177755 RepID=A0A1E2RZL3_9HYPH|nr:hypothetical protein [Methyloligella halotolerans]ODA67651.1 hypothetical protein A7A08_01686 [Methyloligella halotolerans]